MKRWQRLLIAGAVPLCILLAVTYILFVGRGLRCPFYELTGLYCPGCGSGRAVTALLHGRVGAAFRWNPLVFLLGIPAGLVFLREYLRLVFPALGWQPVPLPRWTEWACVAVVFSFWILRNLPAFAFLAPA